MSQAESAKWTNGNAWGSKLVTVIVVAAIACGPIALVVAHNAQTRPSIATTGKIASALSPLQQSAGAYAVGFVGAWLSATQDDSAALDRYINSDSASFSSTAFSYQNIAVASVTAVGPSMMSVVVAADVKDATISDTAQTWPRRYFQVAVSDAKNTLSVVALPAPVTGPRVSDAATNLQYTVQLSSNDKAAQPVLLFLAAYLTGQGETEPYTSPSTNIQAISPHPYSSVTPVTILANSAPPTSPADGAALSVLATVSVQNEVGQQLTTTYALSLRARAGRWEIARLDDAPTAADTTTSIAPTPSPTGGSTQEGK